MARRLRALSKQYECLFSCPGAKLATAGRALVSIDGKLVEIVTDATPKETGEGPEESQ